MRRNPVISRQLRANSTMSQNPAPIFSPAQQLASTKISMLPQARGNVGFAALSGMPAGKATKGSGLLRGMGLLRGRGKKKAKKVIGGKALTKVRAQAKRAKRRGCKK